MSKRKTIDVLWLLEKANYALANSQDESKATGRDAAWWQAWRLGISSQLENVLLETGNYAGFGYIGGNDRDGNPKPSPTPLDVKNGNYDDSRRVYYFSTAMRYEKTKAEKGMD